MLIVVFLYMLMWIIYELWGWGIGDVLQMMVLLCCFGLVIVLNGYIYQIVLKVEGNVMFYIVCLIVFLQLMVGNGLGFVLFMVLYDWLLLMFGVMIVEFVGYLVVLLLYDVMFV